MRFNSPIYLAFLPIVVLAVWLTPPRARRWVLLVASYLFYASWHWPYLGLLVGSAALNHWGAKWIVAGPPNRKWRGGWVLAANVLLLAVFKYLSWLCDNVNAVASWLGLDQVVEVPHWILPLGISFYVFEAISYTVDIVRKRERIHSFWDFQLFIALFPKLIAGPIMRAKELLPQIENPPARLLSSAFLDGIWLITTGMFIKIVLADGIAPSVDQAFSRPLRKRRRDRRVADGRGLRVANLFRLFQLQPHGDRLGQAVRHSVGRQLQLSLFGHIAGRFLESLAHVAVALDSRLPVLSAAGQESHAWAPCAARP